MNLEERVERLENAVTAHMGKENFDKNGTAMQENLRQYIMYWLNPDNERYHHSGDKLESLGFKWGEKGGITREDLWVVLKNISDLGLTLK